MGTTLFVGFSKNMLYSHLSVYVPASDGVPLDGVFDCGVPSDEFESFKSSTLNSASFFVIFSSSVFNSVSIFNRSLSIFSASFCAAISDPKYAFRKIPTHKFLKILDRFLCWNVSSQI